MVTHLYILGGGLQQRLPLSLLLLAHRFVIAESRGISYGNKGTGMGLASVKTIVESVGGNICVDSKLKVGTNFTISIPC